ncbi:MAG: peptidase M19, partial [Merismopedia sp. SIO2A8]|nr:peptidase M19 [Merismopedia sp. SIO2A8]
GNLVNIDRLYDAGFRIIGLSHFFDNEVAASTHGISQGGLTPFGQDAIKRMDELSLIIDLAHASSQTVDDVLEITNRPVLVSHTGVQGTCDGVRNLSDRHLQQIAATGGLIGIGYWQTAVCGNDVNAIIRAIRYVADQVGVEHVALGSDFDGAVRVPFDVSHLDQITQGLQQDGFTDLDIQKIMGLNVVNVLQHYLP